VPSNPHVHGDAHTMKVSTGCGNKAVHILNVSTRSRQAVSFMFWVSYHWIKGLSILDVNGPQDHSGNGVERTAQDLNRRQAQGF
jgi:hypothetical protein